MKILNTLLFIGFSLSIIGQNIGIGTTTPTNGRLVVRGTVGAVAAMFGDNTTGVAIENSYPGIGLNTYFNGSRKYISAGFGGLFGLNPNNGDMYLMNTATSGAADGAATLNSRIFISGASGNVGINTDNPFTGKLTVDATGSANSGIYVKAFTGTTNGIFSEMFTTSSTAYAIRGFSTNGIGVYAVADLNGTALKTSGKSELDAPVLINTSIGGASALYVNGTGNSFGIRAEMSGGTAAIRAYGYGNNSAAISAENVGAGSHAIYATGNVHVQGTLSKSAGSFKIDHPQDPANKFLVHSFVESPDMINVYNGNISTDKNGLAIVQLPTYFEAENIDFKYQLTILGKKFAQAIVFEEIKNNQFTIKTDKPNIKISWMVTGIRNDAYAQKNRLVSEVEKTEQEKGKYLSPELFNESKEKSIGYMEKK